MIFLMIEFHAVNGFKLLYTVKIFYYDFVLVNFCIIILVDYMQNQINVIIILINIKLIPH